VRSEYAGRYEQVASDHAGTASASLALLEAGQLRRELGELGAAQETWRRAAASADGSLRGVAYERVAQANEEAGRFAAAAGAYAQAAGISGYPRRYQAMAEAARCWAEAGDASQAVALYKRIQAESPETRLAPHVAARLRELEASQR
jgi:tetratricopeptide (TPR) repeat protein